MATIALDTNTFWALLIGNMFGLVFLVLVILWNKFTPAKVFFIAWLKKKSIMWIMSRTGQCEFLVAEDNRSGNAYVKGKGPFHLTENSQVSEKRSRLPIYIAFQEYARTIDKDYPAILQSLKEAGYTIKTYDDYQHIIKLATDKQYQAQILKNFDQKDHPETFKRVSDEIKKLSELKVRIDPYKTYNMHDLVNKFPDGHTPAFQEAQIVEEMAIKNKQQQFNKQFMLVGAISLTILLIGLGVFLVMYKPPACQCIMGAAQAATENLVA